MQSSVGNMQNTLYRWSISLNNVSNNNIISIAMVDYQAGKSL